MIITLSDKLRLREKVRYCGEKTLYSYRVQKRTGGTWRTDKDFPDLRHTQAYLLSQGMDNRTVADLRKRIKAAHIQAGKVSAHFLKRFEVVV